jgi:glycosyltransferase involved in cell wall biosynthesis
VKEHLVEIARTIAQNHPEENRKSKLFVDISELVHRDAKTGIQRVVRSILRELLLNPPEKYAVIPVYGSLEHLGYKTANHFLSEFMDGPKLNEDIYIEAQAGDVFLGLDLQHHVVAAQSSYLKHLHRMGVKIYFVIYDLLPILLPDAFPLGSSDVHASWLKEISQYDGVTCISKAVAEEFRVWQKANIPPKLRPLEIKWFHLGADIENSNPTMGIPKNADDVFHAIGGRKTFLMVGTVEPRKGHEYVLEEFISLWKSGVDVNLVIVGKTGWAVEGLAQNIMSNPEYEKRLFWLNGVTDEYLEKVYQLSTCLIAASYGEGFGLPLIEAAQHGLPIIARDIPVFKEIASSNAYYFNEYNTGELKLAINEWLVLYKDNNHPTSSNIPWLSWSESRAQLIKTLSIFS